MGKVSANVCSDFMAFRVLMRQLIFCFFFFVVVVVVAVVFFFFVLLIFNFQLHLDSFVFSWAKKNK